MKNVSIDATCRFEDTPEMAEVLMKAITTPDSWVELSVVIPTEDGDGSNSTTMLFKLDTVGILEQYANVSEWKVALTSNGPPLNHSDTHPDTPRPF